MITTRSFGKTPAGQETTLYTIENKKGAYVSILDYGGIWVSACVPDKDGKLGDVLLGYNDAAGYIPTSGYLGALIGRVGNDEQILHIGKHSCSIYWAQVIMGTQYHTAAK